MSEARITILEGRVAALEKELQTESIRTLLKYVLAQKEKDTPVEKVADADDKTERIMSIIKELSTPVSPIYMSFTEDSLKRGIRKALNEFYSGPTYTERIAELEEEIMRLQSDRDLLWHRLQKARDILDEDPEVSG